MLETLEFFSSLTPSEIQEIARIAKRMEFRRGETIFQQGDVSRDLYAIESGLVEISTKSVLAETKVLAQLKNGDLFGEMALFDAHSVRSASARALQNSIVIVIPGTEFERLLKEKPTISFKLLGTLSKRLKDANQRPPGGAPGAPAGPGKIITVAGPRNGVGKTTFAVTAAQILDQEAGARTLFLDLDLPFADATYALGVHSVRTVIEFSGVARGDYPDFDAIRKHLTHVGTNLFCLPGPVNIIDGEKLDPQSLVVSIRLLQRFFEYIVIDTDSRIDEVFLAALDLSDRIYFVVDAQHPYAIKSSSRYFYGLGKLHLAESRISVLLARSAQPADRKALANLLRLPVQAQLPVIPDHQPVYGKGMLPAQAGHPFCHTVRQLLQDFFPVEFRASRQQGFLSRLFAPDGAPAAAAIADKTAPLAEVAENRVGFRDANFRALLRYIRTGLVAGQLAEARRAILQLVELSGTSAPVFQTYGEILMQEGKASEAIDAFHKAVQLDPDCHLALGFAGILSLDRGLFQQAVALLQRKIDKHPNWPDLRRDLGELFLRNDRPEEALSTLQEALRINPRYEDARVRLAEAYFRLGRGEEAIRELLAMSQKSAPAYYLLGRCFQSVDRFPEALEALRIVQRICPDYRDTNQRIDELQDYFVKLNNLISIHQKIRREQPTYLDVRLKLAQLLASAGRRSEAEAECRDALLMKPGFKAAQDQLDRLLNLPVYEIDHPEVPSPTRTCRGVVCTGFHIGLNLGDQALEPAVQERLSKHLFWFRNIRTGKTWEFKIPPTLSPHIDLSATPICPVTENDVILVKLLNPQTGEVLFSDAHLIDTPREPHCQIKLDFSGPLRQIIDRLPLITPVRVFLLGVPRETLFPKGKDHDVLTPPLLVNPRNGARAEGRVDPDQPGQFCFVLSAPTEEDVVKIGDLLEVHLAKEPGKGTMALQVRVGPDDLVSCSRLLAPEEGEKPLPSEAPSPTPDRPPWPAGSRVPTTIPPATPPAATHPPVPPPAPTADNPAPSTTHPTARPPATPPASVAPQPPAFAAPAPPATPPVPVEPHPPATPPAHASPQPPATPPAPPAPQPPVTPPAPAEPPSPTNPSTPTARPLPTTPTPPATPPAPATPLPPAKPSAPGSPPPPKPPAKPTGSPPPTTPPSTPTGGLPPAPPPRPPTKPPAR
ncbi:MAG: tetratricopeptide repeat protein [Candidatus Riflebacteria bacterium]|nr:tetratricopeptide repeat protein [Candidatus Riflebacteria bacterium]